MDCKNKFPAWRAWSGYAFEAVCLKHIKQIKTALFIPPGALSGSWYCRSDGHSYKDGVQIDLLFDRDDGVVTLCEIKYCVKPFEIDKKYSLELAKNINVFKNRVRTEKQIFLAMVSAAGLKINKYSEELITGKASLSVLFH